MRAYGSVLMSMGLLLLFPARSVAYRTGGDLPELSDTERVRWASPEISFSIDVGGVPTVPFAEAASATRRGLNRWTDVACSDLAWVEASGSGAPVADDGRNGIGWLSEGWVERGFPENTAGTTDIIYRRNEAGDWEIVEADILLNADDFEWRTSSGEVDSRIRAIEAIVAHEAGHALGLLHVCETDGAEGAPLCGDSSEYAERTMYPLYTGPEQATLGADDEAGLCFLYPGCGACPDATTCVDGQCEPLCGTRVCTAGEQCVDGACQIPERPGDPCEHDDTCGDGRRCVERRCEGVGLVGDPCGVGAECQSGRCGPDGYCTTACDVGCPAGFRCQGDVCIAEGGVLGDACEGGEACASGVCLSGASSTSTCTRFCADDTPCPIGHVCKEIGGSSVCAPRASSGCSVTAVGGDDAASASLWVLAFVLVGWSWRKNATRQS